MRLSLFAVAVLMFGCASRQGTAHSTTRGTLYSPASQTAETAWSEAERTQPLAMRNLRRTPEASFHLLRVQGQRDAHVHAKSDAVMFLLAGELEVDAEGRKFTLRPGDVLELPRQMAYALNNRSAEPSVAYVVFTPALAADDDVASVQAGRESVWKWNLWVQ